MKKIVTVIACLILCLSLGGCFDKMYTRTDYNTIKCDNCVTVTNIESLVSNIEKTMNDVSVVRLDYTLVNTKTTFNAKIDIIAKDKRINWDMFAIVNFEETDINIYLKDGKLYVIYPHNGANVILKDDLKKFVKEAETSLNLLNATYDKENLEDFMLGDKLSGFNFDNLKESASYNKNSDGTYLMTYQEPNITWEADFTSNYLTKELRASAENFTSVLKFDYPDELTIKYPMGLDFLTLNIEEVKEILKVDSFAEVIDKDLKSK